MGRRCWVSDALRATITGSIEDVPTLLPRKQVPERVTTKGDNKCFRFEVTKEKEEAKYVGIAVDGNGRFLRDDLLVVQGVEMK
ncbi:uncharacterized protein JCM6883_003612 [Sporobolomyces salmoneus]|uniref:uncharacterized protein n=1 Tax=Sporobolomyces salmoneus TaxID=183962 RepID=UPI00317B2CD2